MKHDITTPEYIAIVQQQVCARLGVTVDALSETMLETGVSFLKAYYKDVPLMASLMERDRMFWNWWKVEWHLRNLTFLEDDEMFHLSSWKQLLVYSEFNNYEALIGQIRPPRIVTLPVYKSLKKVS